MQRGAVSADQVNQRYFTQYSGVEKGQRFSVDEITLFKEDRHYTIMGGAAGSKPTCHYETIPAVCCSRIWGRLVAARAATGRHRCLYACVCVRVVVVVGGGAGWPSLPLCA